MSDLQAYGFAFITPLIIRSLVPPKKFYPVLLVTDNAKQIKENAINFFMQETSYSTYMPNSSVVSNFSMSSFFYRFQRQANFKGFTIASLNLKCE